MRRGPMPATLHGTVLLNHTVAGSVSIGLRGHEQMLESMTGHGVAP